VICPLCWCRRAKARLPFAPGSISPGLQKLHQEKAQLLQPHPPPASACSKSRSVPNTAKSERLIPLTVASKAFQTGHHGKDYQVLSHWARWSKGYTQGVLHSPSSPLNQMLFFPLQCNWKALISASRTGKRTGLKHSPQHCPHLFLINLPCHAPVPHLQCTTVCWDRTSLLFRMTEYLPASVVYHFFNIQLRLHQFQLQKVTDKEVMVSQASPQTSVFTTTATF